MHFEEKVDLSITSPVNSLVGRYQVRIGKFERIQLLKSVAPDLVCIQRVQVVHARIGNI